MKLSERVDDERVNIDIERLMKDDSIVFATLTRQQLMFYVWFCRLLERIIINLNRFSSSSIKYEGNRSKQDAN
jgi:hypothetical protein